MWSNVWFTWSQISMIMHWWRIPYSDIRNKTIKKDNWSWFGWVQFTFSWFVLWDRHIIKRVRYMQGWFNGNALDGPAILVWYRWLSDIQGPLYATGTSKTRPVCYMGVSVLCEADIGKFYCISQWFIPIGIGKIGNILLANIGRRLLNTRTGYKNTPSQKLLGDRKT
jgi:hypothetical protein